MIDASIPLQVKPIQAPDRLNMMAQVLGIQANQNQNALAQYSLTKAARQDDQTNALMRAIQSGEIDPTTAQGISRASAIAPESPVIANLLKARETQSTIGKNDAEAGKFSAETAAKVTSQYRDQLANVNTPEQGAAWLAAQYKDPVLGKVVGSVPFEQAVAAIPTDPAQFADWRTRNSLGMAEYIKQNKPTVHVQNLGGASNVISTPGLGGAPTVLSSTPITQSADNKATNATHIQAVNIEQGGANSRNAASIAAENTRSGNTLAKDYAVAGLNKDGTPLAVPTPNGKEEDWVVNAATRFNLTGDMPRNLGRGGQSAQNILRIQREAARQNAEAGLTPEQLAVQQVTAKRALTSFAPGGKDGAAVESADTALNHLDTLRQLAEAQGNGNIQLFNQIANTIGAQTGQPAPTNLQGAVTMVGPEISKAVIGSGGGVGDREKVEAALGALVKGGPAQAAGQIATMQDLFGGRLMEKQRSYERGTGMKDFATGGFLSPAAQRVLAARTQATPAAGAAPAAMPPDIAAILQKHGR